MTRHPKLDPNLDVIASLPLCAFDNFLLWKFGRDSNGKLTKLPRNIDGHPCAWKNPLARASFAQVAAAYRQRYRPGSHLWGIGYVFADDHYVALDLDDCRNAETGAINNFAREILAAFPMTYAEVSPSGLGLHIIGASYPKPPNFKNHAAGIEMIASTFLTLTGHVVNR